MEELREARVEALAVRPIDAPPRKVQQTFVEALQQIEHRAILLLAEAAGDVNNVIGRDANEVLVEGSVVDRAETEAVGYDGLAALFEVADNVRCVKEAQLP